VNVRRQIKSTPYGSVLWRIFIGIIGGLITVIGSVLLFAPGPGLLVLLALGGPGQQILKETEHRDRSLFTS